MPADATALIEPPVDPAKLAPMIAPRRTALVIIDVQEDFVSSRGAPGRWGIDLSVLDGPIEMAWDMASLSCYILRSDMVYRAPDSKKPGFTFLSLRNFRQS